MIRRVPALPDILLYLLVVYLPFSARFSGRALAIVPGMTPLALLIAGVIVFWILGRYETVERPSKWTASPLLAPVAVFLALAWFSIFRHAHFGLTDYAVPALKRLASSWMIPFLLYFIFFNAFNSKTRIKTAALLMMAAVTLAALWAAYEYLGSGKRVGGIFSHPNRLASFFNYSMFLLLAVFLFFYKKPWSWLFLGAFLACVRGLMVTFSRGGYMAFALGLYSVAFFRSKLVFLVLIMAGGLVWMNPELLPAGVRWRLGQTIETRPGFPNLPEIGNVHVDRSSGDRLEIWKAALVMMRENPAGGIGYGRFPEKVQNYWYAGAAFDAHNTYLQIGAELGVPGLLCFGWLLAVLFWKTVRVYYKTNDRFFKALALGMLGGFTGNLWSFFYVSRLDYTEIMAYFWILAAMMTRIEKEISQGEFPMEAAGSLAGAGRA